MSFDDLLRNTMREVVREELRAIFPERSSSPTQIAGLLTAKAAAKQASVSVATLTKWTKQGLKVYGSGPSRRFRWDDVLAFLEQRKPVQVDVDPETRAAEIFATLKKGKR